MNKKINYKYLIISSSLAVAGLTTYSTFTTNDSYENTNFNFSNNDEITRTISKTAKINVLPENNILVKSYDYNNGVATGTVLKNIIQVQEKQPEQRLFTLDEVNAIKENLLNEYNNNLYSNLSEYENYISNLTNDYLSLEKDYFDTLNNISDFLNSEVLIEDEKISTPQYTEESSSIIQNMQNDSSEIKNKLENIQNPENENTKTREEEIDALYRSALSYASENLNKLENIQTEDANNKTD